MECLADRWNGLMLSGTPVAKAITWPRIDAERRKRGERNGLETHVVRAVNNVSWVSVLDFGRPACLSEGVN